MSPGPDPGRTRGAGKWRLRVTRDCCGVSGAVTGDGCCGVRGLRPPGHHQRPRCQVGPARCGAGRRPAWGNGRRPFPRRAVERAGGTRAPWRGLMAAAAARDLRIPVTRVIRRCRPLRAARLRSPPGGAARRSRKLRAPRLVRTGLARPGKPVPDQPAAEAAGDAPATVTGKRADDVQAVHPPGVAGPLLPRAAPVLHPGPDVTALLSPDVHAELPAVRAGRAVL